MRVSSDEIFADTRCQMYCAECKIAIGKPEEWGCPGGEHTKREYAMDLAEARAMILAMRGDFQGIICNKLRAEDVMHIAKNALEDSKEYSE